MAAAAATCSPVEAARLAGILEEALEKLSFLAALTPAAVSGGDEAASALVGEEIRRTLGDQRALEARYEELIEARSAAKLAANKAKAAELGAQASEVSLSLREGMRHLCRLLRDSPDIQVNLSQIAEERTELMELLARTVAELRGSGSFATLAGYVAAQEDARAAPRKAAAREAAVLKEVETVTAELRQEAAAHAEVMAGRRAEIDALKAKLYRLRGDNTLTLRYARKEAAARCEAAGKAFLLDEADAAGEVEELRERLAKENEVAEASAETLRGEVAEAAAETERWKARLAPDLAAKEEELRRLVEARDAQHAELLTLQERYETDLAGLARTMSEAEQLRADKLAAAALEQQRAKAANTISAILAPMFLKVKAVADLAAEAKAASKAAGAKKKK